ncbi:MAG: AlpA family phage regulatory protein [Candidatus Thiothrix moscowensis]|nr:AlpA family phage regulatory protein [Candidatus Thiothrix moscowensis]
MKTEQATQERYIKQKEVLERTGLSSNTIRTLEKQGRFPRRRELSTRAVRWWLPDVLAWMQNPAGWQASAAA